MKSICIKTNNSDLLNYLLNELDYIKMKNIYISSNQFKNYKNVIVHYKGDENEKFIYEISRILSCLVIDELEENLLKKQITKNYFYFNTLERKDILNQCYDIFADSYNKYFDTKFNFLKNDFYDYLKQNKSLILTGFVNFRIKNYMMLLDSVIDEAVNSYLIEKEYYEFISLLQLYVNSQTSRAESIHLVYKIETSLLLDENKKVINISDDIFKIKYLSDISFSSNDYALNALLSLIPKKIYIHLIDNTVDEFIHTLGLIFENRVFICSNCEICKLYKNKDLLITNPKS